MLTHHIAFELSQERVRYAEERATLMGRLGDLPKPRGMHLFRRDVKPLERAVEVRRLDEEERIRRWLLEISTARAATDSGDTESSAVTAPFTVRRPRNLTPYA